MRCVHRRIVWWQIAAVMDDSVDNSSSDGVEVRYRALPVHGISVCVHSSTAGGFNESVWWTTRTTTLRKLYAMAGLNASIRTSFPSRIQALVLTWFAAVQS